MNNMSIVVNIEGEKDKVISDWQALQSTLRLRKINEQALLTIYEELNAGLIVTTRGLTLAKSAESTEFEGVIKPITVHHQLSGCL